MVMATQQTFLILDEDRPVDATLTSTVKPPRRKWQFRKSSHSVFCWEVVLHG